MLRVTVELVPHGNEDRAKKIAEMVIANDGTGNNRVGNYRAAMKAEYGVKHATLTGFFRLKQSVWTLIGGFLKEFGHTKHSPKLINKCDEDPLNLERLLS